MIHEKIIEALAPLNVPVGFHEYEPLDDNPFITFFQYNERTALSVDDEEAFTEYYVQINLFSKSDYGDLLKSLKDCMKSIRAKRLSEIELKTDEWYQRTIRFILIYSKEEI